MFVNGSRRDFLGKSTNQKEELPVVGMFFLANWAEMSNLYKGPSIDASYQISVHLIGGFRREDC